MTQILLFEKSYQRIKTALNERVPQADVVVWQADGSLLHRGRAVATTEVKPRVAWISGDVLGDETFAAFAATLAKLPSLEWAQSANAGLDHPAYVQLAQSGIEISKSGAQSIAIAEYVLTYALAHRQGLALRGDAQAARRWQARLFDELWHSRWLIIGYGHIGRNVAIRAKAFDCHTTIVRRETTADEFADLVIALEDVRAHLPRADVIVLACPATAATRGMVDESFLNATKETALLINVARGSLLDENVLMKSLDAGRPAHAVLDVFETEPLPCAAALWRHPCITVTAHTSNAGSGTRSRGDELFLSNLERFIAGDTPLDIAAV